jgi:hypothetical protein
MIGSLNVMNVATKENVGKILYLLVPSKRTGLFSRRTIANAVRKPLFIDTFQRSEL